MKRRDFFFTSASAAAIMSLPFSDVFSGQLKIKIGILPQVFKASGYGIFKDSKSVKQYSSFKTAYVDLLENKIDVLVSSPKLLSQFKPEFSLVGAHASNSSEVNKKWVQESHAYVSDFHAQFGLKSVPVGQFSPLRVRISNLSFEELSQWKGRKKAVSVAASGVDAVGFEHMGLYVKQEPSMLKLSMQLVEMSQNHLNLTDAFAPALFLNAFMLNHKIDVYPCKPPLQNLVMVDHVSGSAAGIELVFREGESSPEVEKLRVALSSFLQQDEQFQKAALKTMLDLPNFTFADSLPLALSEPMANYNRIYIDALKGHHNVSLSILDNFRQIRGES